MIRVFVPLIPVEDEALLLVTMILYSLDGR